MTLDEIKQTMVTDDTPRIGEALRELLAKEPDNVEAKLLYGSYSLLLGDEATFRRVHDELVPEMKKRSEGILGDAVSQSELSKNLQHWRIYCETLEILSRIPQSRPFDEPIPAAGANEQKGGTR